jgi:hypothetical protein
VKLQAAFLADAAMGNVDGTFMVWRGGITDMFSSAFPAPIRFVLVLRIEADREEARRLHQLRMRIMHAEIEIGPWQTAPLAMPDPGEGGRAYLNLLSNIQLAVPQPGEGYIEALVDDDIRLPLLYFRVFQLPAGGLPPGPS